MRRTLPNANWRAPSSRPASRPPSLRSVTSMGVRVRPARVVTSSDSSCETARLLGALGAPSCREKGDDNRNLEASLAGPQFSASSDSSLFVPCDSRPLGEMAGPRVDWPSEVLQNLKSLGIGPSVCVWWVGEECCAQSAQLGPL